MNKYFESSITILGIIFALISFIFSDLDLLWKLFIAFIIMFIFIAISYIISLLKCHKLILETNKLKEELYKLNTENLNLKEELSKTNRNIFIKNEQLKSISENNSNNTIEII